MASGLCSPCAVDSRGTLGPNHPPNGLYRSHHSFPDAASQSSSLFVNFSPSVVCPSAPRVSSSILDPLGLRSDAGAPAPGRRSAGFHYVVDHTVDDVVTRQKATDGLGYLESRESISSRAESASSARDTTEMMTTTTRTEDRGYKTYRPATRRKEEYEQPSEVIFHRDKRRAITFDSVEVRW